MNFRAAMISALLVLCVASLGGAQETTKPEEPEPNLEAYLERIQEIAEVVREHPDDQSLRRYAYEFEQAVDGLPFEQSQRAEFAGLVEGRDALVLGEWHDRRTQDKAYAIRALGDELEARPRILLHEALFERWTPALEEANQGRLSSDGLRQRLRELWEELYADLYPEVERETRVYTAERMAEDLAEVCVAAREAGFELRAGGSVAHVRHLLRRGQSQAFPPTATSLQRRRDVRFGELAEEAVREDRRPFVVFVVGSDHSLGSGRFENAWPGRPPAVLLMASGRCGLEIEARFGREVTTPPEAWPTARSEDCALFAFGASRVFFLAPQWHRNGIGELQRRRGLAVSPSLSDTASPPAPERSTRPGAD